MSPRKGVNNHTPIHLEDKVDYLVQQIDLLNKLIRSLREPNTRYVLTVEELSERWNLSYESIRRLVRDKQLRPLRDFRPFRFTLKEVREFENNDTPRLRGLESKRKGGRR